MSTDDETYEEDYREWVSEDNSDGAQLLDDVEKWFARFIAVTDTQDLALLALWTVHTHLVKEVRTTPRLQIDSIMPGSGKTTVLDHMNRLCRSAMQIASPPSQALIPRILEQDGIRTILLDEVDRILRPDGAATPDLLAIINSGYRIGASRPVLVPTKGGGWEANEMPTFSPVAMAGNAPNLPDDTRSRSIRILLMPDLQGVVEDSDWEYIEADAKQLQQRIIAFADTVRDDISGLAVDLPAGCIGRAKEKWRPLKRVAVAAGGQWPERVDTLIRRGLAEDEAEREAGLKTLPPGVVLLQDLATFWPEGADFVATRRLVELLIERNPEYWGAQSGFGKALTDTRLGRLLSQAAKVTSIRRGGVPPRGYLLSELLPVWRQLQIKPPKQPDEPDEPDEPDGSNPQKRLVAASSGSSGSSTSSGSDPTPGATRRPGCVCISKPEPCYWCKLANQKEDPR